MTTPDDDPRAIDEFQQPSETEPAIRLRRYSADATGNIFEVVDEDGVILGRIDKDGNFQSANGGSQTKRVRFDFTHATTGMGDGVVAYTPAVGETVIDGWFEGTVNFDGSTPEADFGTFVGESSGGIGFYGNIDGPVDLASITTKIPFCGEGLSLLSAGQGSAAHLYATLPSAFPLISDGTPIKVVANFTSTVGAATLVLVISTAA